SSGALSEFPWDTSGSDFVLVWPKSGPSLARMRHAHTGSGPVHPHPSPTLTRTHTHTHTHTNTHTHTQHACKYMLSPPSPSNQLLEKNQRVYIHHPNPSNSPNLRHYG